MTRSRMYALTGVSVVIYVLLNIIFSSGRFSFEHLWDSETIAHGTIFTYLFLVLIVVAGVWHASQLPESGIVLDPPHETSTLGQVDDPKTWKLFIGNVHYAILWLPLRFFVGRAWVEAGEHKLRDEKWMDGGLALKGYWTGAIGGSSPSYSCDPVKDAAGAVVGAPDAIQCVTVTEIAAKSKVVADYKWFEDFIRYMLDNGWYDWFAKLISWGEFLVGLGLIVGALVGIAAFFGSFMNINFMLAGTTSSNPVLFALTVFLVIGWKVAGYFGLDRVLLPALGTPWHRHSGKTGDSPTTS